MERTTSRGVHAAQPLLTRFWLCSKFVTAADVAAKDARWAEWLQLECPYTLFLASDTSFSQPLFLGNKFWPGAPNLECMFDYDVVRNLEAYRRENCHAAAVLCGVYCAQSRLSVKWPHLQRWEPSVKILRQWAQVLQRFFVSDYDVANGDKISDTLYKSIDQRCLLEGLNFDALVAEMTNDDIAATHLQMDPEIEELVELAMQAREAEIEAGVFNMRVEEARAARDLAQRGRESVAAKSAAWKGGRRKGTKAAEGGPGARAGGAAKGAASGGARGARVSAGEGRPEERQQEKRAPPVLDELKLIQLLLDKGADMIIVTAA